MKVRKVHEAVCDKSFAELTRWAEVISFLNYKNRRGHSCSQLKHKLELNARAFGASSRNWS